MILKFLDPEIFNGCHPGLYCSPLPLAQVSPTTTAGRRCPSPCHRRWRCRAARRANGAPAGVRSPAGGGGWKCLGEMGRNRGNRRKQKQLKHTKTTPNRKLHAPDKIWICLRIGYTVYTSNSHGCHHVASSKLP